MISENAKYWIWITQALGYNTNKIAGLCELYSDISEFVRGGEKEWRFCGLLTDRDIQKLRSTDMKVANQILSDCKHYGYSVLCVDDEKYPVCLRNIYAPPAVLYINGTMPDVDHRLTVGIVGTRKASMYGKENSYKIGYSLSKYGVCTVSGGALGIDCACHRGSLAADGVTICVLGCGINYNYLRENEGMRNAIARKGAVISEYPPDTAPINYHFPARNRIIAALSDGVLIIESGSTSGSLITANLALEMGKELFALLGNNSPQNEGSNQRIKEGTAIPITDFMDIIAAFDNVYATDDKVDLDNISLADIEAIPVKGKSPSGKRPVTFIKEVVERDKIEELLDSAEEVTPLPKHKDNLNLTGDMKKIYEYLNVEPVHIDTIAYDLEIPVFRALTALTQLEVKDLIQTVQGRKFMLK